MRGVTGSGARANVYADVGPPAAENLTTGNVLDFTGGSAQCATLNTAIDPAPPAKFFMH
jgi:hypothetical protein